MSATRIPRPVLLSLFALAGAALTLGYCGRFDEGAGAAGAAGAPRSEEPSVVARFPLDPEPLAAPAVEGLPGEVSPWKVLNEEATLALSAGDVAGAVEKFARCHAAEPGQAVFSGNLAEALVRLARLEHDNGALASAVEHLARAIELAPGRADASILAQILERWRRELELAQDDWTEGSSRFELSFDTDRGDILHHSHEVLEHLERSYEELRRWFGSDPLDVPGEDASPLRVVLYDSGDFDRLTGLGDWAGGVFDGVLRISVDELTPDGGAWRSVVMHELVHAFVQRLSGSNAPGWLNEGLAQLLEARPGLVERQRERLRGAELFPLEQLTGSLASWPDREHIARAYAQSLVFVDYLRQNFGDEALRRMVLGAGGGRSITEPFQAWTGVSIEIAFRDWQAELGR